MPRSTLIAVAVCAGLLLAPQARAEPLRAVLIIGNAAISGVPGCAKSANTVSATLRALGFDLTERQDASIGGIDAGIAEVAQRLAGRGGTAFIYAHGYATDFNSRTFLQPTTTRIARPSDVMTQGPRDSATSAVVAFDLVPAPDGPPKIDLDALPSLPVPDGVGVISVTDTTPADAPTSLAAALARSRVRTEDLVDSVRPKLAGGTIVASVNPPVRPGFLAGAPQPVVAKPPPPADVLMRPSAPVPVVAVPLRRSPDEARMTDVDRRKVRTAPVRPGCYGNLIDGRFGPETRAAIRRRQHEIGNEMTGRLTADQAGRLVNMA